MSKKNTIKSPLLNVTEAAEFLNVHTGTIRRWAYSNQLKGTKLGIRGDWRFKEEDLEKMAHTNSLTKELLSNSIMASPHVDINQIADNAHFVQFYENDTSLINAIKQFINSGDVAVVVVTPEHKKSLEEVLIFHGIDLASAIKEGSYIYLDAEETLSKFMVDELPSAKLFYEVVGGVITKATKNKQKVRAFGEMVALLWADGIPEAAIMLEQLWNELQKIHSFTLFCAYPLNGFGQNEHAIHFERISQTHSHVIPSESYSTLDTEDKRLRQIAILQQKAQALEAEIALHKQTEIKLLKTVSALKYSEDFNKRIIENSADCIKVLDLEGHLLTINQPGCKAFEFEDITPFLGQDYRNFWKDGYYNDVSLAIEKAKNGEVGRYQGFCLTFKGTPKWWDVVISPIYNDNGEVEKLLAISRDITAIKELEQRKDDFLSATSHELKTPLTSQKAFIQLLQRHLEKTNDPNYSRFVNKIDAQTDKLTKLVNDLLDASKVQGGRLVLNKSNFNFNTCIKNAVEEIQTVSKTHKIIVKGKIETDVYADKDKISQVIINLLTNAIKYSPHADKVNVIIKQSDNSVVVEVQDFGIGIDKKDKQYVFERFFRVSDSDEKTYPGLGMGLYIVSEIIKQHGGEIMVESTKGKGSTFIFSFPRQ